MLPRITPALHPIRAQATDVKEKKMKIRFEHAIGGLICGACTFLLLQFDVRIWLVAVGVMVPYIGGLVIGMWSITRD